MRGLRSIVTGVLLAAVCGAAPGWAQDPPLPLPKAEELDAQAKREIAQALRTLPFSLRAKLERLFSGDATAAAEVTEAERRLIAKLPEAVRDRILERLPETESRPDGRDNQPSGSKDTPAGQTPSDEDDAAAKRAAKTGEAGEAAPKDAETEQTEPAGRPALADLPLFGLEFFRRALDAAPAGDLPLGADYVVGPGDTLEVRIFSRVEDVRVLEADVERDGTVAFPKVGPVTVRGRALGDVEKMLRDALGRIYRDATIHVGVGRLRSIPVYVTGEVTAPGLHRVAGGSTLLHALFTADGPTERGSLRRITLRRNGQAPVVFDLYAFLTQGDRRGDMRLQPEDVVHVPMRGPTAGVAGAVLRPGRYELGEGTTVQRLLELAGGITALGYRGGVQVERSTKGARRELLDLPAARFTEAAKDGDLVWAAPLEGVVRNTVEIRGHVERPGEYEFTADLRVRDLLERGGRLLPETHMARAEIFRTAGDPRAFRLQPGGAPFTTAREVIPVDLTKLLAGDAGQNVALRPLDRLVIYAEQEIRPPLTVRVTGEVYRAGDVAFSAGMKVSDLLFRAGGASLPPTAYLARADLRRLSERPGSYAYAARSELARAPRTVISLNLGTILAGEGADDIELQPFDELVIYAEHEVRPAPTVSVTGAVQRPQTVELAEGMRVTDLLHRAGGVLPNAHLGRAEIVRRIYDPTQPESYRIQVIAVALDRALSGVQSADPVLENFDQLIVKRVSDFAITVLIEGEVRHPGEYTLPLGARISDLMERAGGYARNAYPEGAVFTRESVKETQEAAMKRFVQEQRRRLLELESDSQLDASSDASAAKLRSALQVRRELLDELARTEVIGRLAVRIDDTPGFARTTRNLVLRDGDALRIPAEPASVTVQGYVYNPATVVYERARTIRFFIDRAGGLREEADETRIHVIRPDGSARPSIGTRQLRWDAASFRWVYGRVEAQVGPGDVIIVPPAVRVVSGWDVTKDIVDILFKTALAAGTVAAIG
ncbi:MAG: SLBB domain-containing protein [Planctomycetota bacterium]|jgi:protein involved in polysaccharide export with SLBB domain